MNLLILLVLNGFFVCGGALKNCLKTSVPYKLVEFGDNVHILRTPKDRLIHVALEAQLLLDSPSNLFLDAPPFKDLEDLRNQARDRAG